MGKRNGNGSRAFCKPSFPLCSLPWAVSYKFLQKLRAILWAVGVTQCGVTGLEPHVSCALQGNSTWERKGRMGSLQKTSPGLRRALQGLVEVTISGGFFVLFLVGS